MYSNQSNNMAIKIFITIFLSLPILTHGQNTNINGRPHSITPRVDFTVPTGISSVFPFSGSEITMPEGQKIRYYSSDISKKDKPLVIFLPGSGCTGAFPALPDEGHSMGPEGFALQFREKARLIVFENPGIDERFSRETNSECSSEFKKMANMQDRLNALKAAIDDMRDRGWINRQPLMVVAGSEGVSIASRLAKSTSEVSHLLLISGFGIGQTLSTIHAALTYWGNWSFAPETGSNNYLDRLQSTLTSWEHAHRGLGQESNRTIAGYDGTYWQTIGKASPAEDVLASKAQLYLVQGGRDQSASAIDYEAGIAYLVAHDRPFVTEYFPCGDHFLACPDDQGEPKNLQGIIERGMEWFLTARVQSIFAASFNPSPSK
ncbi:hypothetical protein [Burkholderia sp. Nafp2/4-1b]|uniref:hypothetical protein n=1 Tax=Burkholderia sp. Nafp2/4-1b TaxID=2116686 RepID=UPI0013CE7026|nr:hypothetical protein [Burkholderia sp. Nafp2/4-1b]